MNGAQSKPTRRERKAATRRAVKGAARRCLRERGYERTSIADIAREAGVAQGTFYVHFPSKEAALDELIADFNASLAEQLEPVLLGADRDEPQASIRRTAEIFLDCWQEHRWLVRCYVQRTAEGLTSEALRDGVNPPMLELLGGVLRARAPQGGAEVDWELATHALLGMWLRVGLRYLLDGSTTRAAAVETLTRATVGAVSALYGGKS